MEIKKPAPNALCSICWERVTEGQPFHVVKTKHGKIHVHTQCYEAEQRELRAERLEREAEEK